MSGPRSNYVDRVYSNLGLNTPNVAVVMGRPGPETGMSSERPDMR